MLEQSENTLTDYDQARNMRTLLWKWAGVPRYIRDKEAEIKDYETAIRDAYETIHAPTITDMPVMHGGVISNVERAVELAETRAELYKVMVEKITEEITDALKLKIAIDEAMSILTDIEQRVINMRYVQRFGWIYIGLKLEKDESRGRSIERTAIKKLSRRIDFTRFYPFS